MVVEERFPRLRRRSPAVHHVFAHAGFADVDPELQQFTVDLRSAPEGILVADRANECRTSSGTAGRPGLPCRIFHVQNKPNPLRCHPTTVEACTMWMPDL